MAVGVGLTASFDATGNTGWWGMAGPWALELPAGKGGVGATGRVGATGAFGAVGAGASAGMFGLIGAAVVGLFKEMAGARETGTACGWEVTDGGGRSGFAWVGAGWGAALAVGVGLTASFDATAVSIGCGVKFCSVTGKRAVT